MGKDQRNEVLRVTQWRSPTVLHRLRLKLWPPDRGGVADLGAVGLVEYRHVWLCLAGRGPHARYLFLCLLFIGFPVSPFLSPFLITEYLNFLSKLPQKWLKKRITLHIFFNLNIFFNLKNIHLDKNTLIFFL